jgi:GDP-L-fucose synthase
MTAPEIFPLAGKRVWVAGHRGMVGSALVRRLTSEDCEILTVERDDLDLRRQQPVENWVADRKPDLIVLAAGHVGGIVANSTYPGEFLYDNIVLETNIIEASRRAEVSRLLFLGSSCVYPRLAPQPIPENALLTSSLEPTNEWYAIAKIAGLKLAQAYKRQYSCDFFSAMPTNLYGPGDNFDLTNSHVLPALMRKTHEAKCSGAPELMVWGSGTPRREFMHVDDCADALIFLATRYTGETHVNIGIGSDIGILELTRLIAEIVGFQGKIRTDPSKPDGMPRKLLDVGLLTQLGWLPRVSLPDGIKSTYRWYLDHQDARGLRR